jgi:hypothetical protein
MFGDVRCHKKLLTDSSRCWFISQHTPAPERKKNYFERTRPSKFFVLIFALNPEKAGENHN